MSTDGRGITDTGSLELNDEPIGGFAEHGWHRHTVETDEHGPVTYAHEHESAGPHDHDDHASALGEPGAVKGPNPDVWGEEQTAPRVEPVPDYEVKGPDPEAWPTQE